MNSAHEDAFANLSKFQTQIELERYNFAKFVTNTLWITSPEVSIFSKRCNGVKNDENKNPHPTYSPSCLRD